MNKYILSYYIKPSYSLLTAAVLLIMVTLLFFSQSKPVSIGNTHTDTSEGAGSFHSPLLCI